MECPRCHGLMAGDPLMDRQIKEATWLSVWQCISCGELFNPSCLAKRAQRFKVRKTGKGRRPFIGASTWGPDYPTAA